MILFISRYKLSYSILLGLGFVVSTGIFIPFISTGSSSMTSFITSGYFSASHRQKAGTPIANGGGSD